MVRYLQYIVIKYETLVYGEIIAMYAAKNICKVIVKFANEGEVGLASIIFNSRNVDNEREIIWVIWNKF